MSKAVQVVPAGATAEGPFVLAVPGAEAPVMGFALPDDLAGSWRVRLDSAEVHPAAEAGEVESPVRVRSPCVMVLERSQWT